MDDSMYAETASLRMMLIVYSRVSHRSRAPRQCNAHQSDLIKDVVKIGLFETLDLRLDEFHVCQYARQCRFVESGHVLPAQRFL
jgi:hypothetical protein